MNARDVMTRPAYTCRLDTTLDEASRFMEENACGTLIVLDGAGRLAGILTDRDLALTIGRTESRPSDVSVVGAMTRNVHTCLPNDDLSLALERMSNAKVRRLPVVDADGKVQGMLSIDDIVLGTRALRRQKEVPGERVAIDLCVRRTRCSRPRLSRSAL